jgi:hypothetical protein
MKSIARVLSAWQLAHFAETTTAKGTKAHEGKAR